jgi:FkbM family methyltransferase
VTPSLVRRLRPLAGLPLLRSALTRPSVERIVATILRATTVRERARFVLRELPRRPVLGRYHLRDSGLVALVRHGTPDVATLDEVFYQREYELPVRVDAALRSLGRKPRVLDLGANIGLFGLSIAASFEGALVTAVEADPFNAEVLRRCVAENVLDVSWEVIEAAAGTSVSFAAGRFSLSRIEEGSGHETVPMIDVMPYLSRADLAKIDIEGGEWTILGDERLAAAAPFLVLEYHPQLCPGENPGAVAESFLTEAGYEVEPVGSKPDGFGLVWATRPL